ncbi:hypothetical protein Lepto7375DRAFT_2081 [Leptolyngbya sp. PCC 7375]|nr:hypothetical protein Lepto7375DRAFT_2081 [Leptolyngbya sp. PCC 7375]
MNIEQETRAANTQKRQHAEQLNEKVLNRAVESLDTEDSVAAEEREQVTQQRQTTEHLKETMLSRAEETLEKSDSDAGRFELGG